MRSPLRTGMTLGVIVLLFLAFNLVWSARIPNLRWDLSPQQSNTLLPPVIQLLSTLESTLDFYYFNSSKPALKSAELKRYGKRVEEKLKTFEQAAKGKINLHIIDPAPFSEDAYKAGLYGLDDRQGFLGLIGTRDGGQAAQRIESFSPEREPLLEYEISHLISQLAHPEPPVIGLLSGLSTQESVEPLLQELHRHFELMELASSADHIPPRIKTLMIIHPRMLAEHTLYAVDQFVLGGGKLLMFIDPENKPGSPTTPSDSRLDGLLTGWGISWQEHPTSPVALPRQAMNTNDISTWKLDSLTLSNSGALFPLDNSRTTFTPLLQTCAPYASPDSDAPESKTSAQCNQRIIAARIEGPAYSAFAQGIDGQPSGLQKAAQIHAVVVAAAHALNEEPDSTAQHNNNLFVLNTLDNLAAPELLVNIRPRSGAGQSLQVLEKIREAAERTYQDKARDLERQWVLTEQEWQRLNPRATALGTEVIDTSTQLQALNKERLRLPIELNALKVEAYAPVYRLERTVKLLVIVPLPALLCLIAWGLFRWRHHRRAVPCAAFY